MDGALRWTAALALALLAIGLFALAIPDLYEGPVVFALDAQHAVRALDLLGAVLIGAATLLTWAVGLAWQRRNHVPGRPPGAARPRGK
jgi:hypothetical protein